jgi:decaprenylphospho-beta-D-ribofuranose 2-oxidase
MNNFVSLDGTESCISQLVEPEHRTSMRQLLSDSNAIALRGSGLSYALASAAPNATTISTRAFDRILSFDQVAGTVCVEAGISIGSLIEFLVGRGWWFPVLPGHPAITVGGCVAFNTHGKTQHDIGQFSDHIVELTLVHPDHGEIVCSPQAESTTFELTVGGMGLTGWIANVTLRVAPLPGDVLVRRTHGVDDYGGAVAMMESHGSSGAHLYSWNDASRRGRAFGRGVVYDERFEVAGHDGADQANVRFRTFAPDRRGRYVPAPFWNRATTSAINRAWSTAARLRKIERMTVLDAAFPINGREAYFHLFGRRGFHEYQVIVPRDSFAETAERVRRSIERTEACVTLSSLKLFSGEPRLLWFRSDGVCLTFDAPATTSTQRFFDDLDKIAVDLGAPVNIAKDSRLDARTVRAVFAGYDEFRERLLAFDPHRRFDSALRRRIDV